MKEMDGVVELNALEMKFFGLKAPQLQAVMKLIEKGHPVAECEEWVIKDGQLVLFNSRTRKYRMPKETETGKIRIFEKQF